MKSNTTVRRPGMAHSSVKKDKNADIDTGKLIDAVFDRFVSRGTFSDCEITFSDISKMKKIFKEEKLYYDFLK